MVEAREDWEEKPLSFFGDIICGKTPPKSNASYFDGNVPFIKIPDMHGQTFIFRTTDTLTESGRDYQKNKTLPVRSICVSCIATVGLVSMNVIESQTNQQINSIVPKEDFYRYFLYLFMLSSRDILEALASGGTATMNLNTGDFSKMLIPYCGDELLNSFNQRVYSFFEKIFVNQQQIQTLETLRDNLLPKLMSGEVRVKL
jgi:type I restriction enzyme S subunit